MPLYEYQCQKCKLRFEVLMSRRSDSPAPKCTGCGSARTRRLVSTFFGRSGGSKGESKAVSGGSGCGGCRRSSCAGCGR